MTAVIPLNALAWGIGAIAAISLGIKMLLISPQGQNAVSRYIGLFSVVIGIGMIFLSVPFIFTSDVYLLKDFQIVGQFFIYVSFIFMALLLREMGFKRKVSKHVILIPVVVFASIATYFETLNETVFLDTERNLVIWNSPQMATYFEAGLIVLLVVPIGILFFQRALREVDTRTKLKLSVIGLSYISIGLIQAYENIFALGEESIQKAVINSIIFLLLIVIVIIPNSLMQLKEK